MSEGGEEQQGKVTTPTQEAPYRNIENGRIYDHLKPNQAIDIAIFPKIEIIIDEENLGLERISLENLQKGWERDKDRFVNHPIEPGADLDPLEIYKYYLIQKKVVQVLGEPTQNAGARSERFREMGDKVKLSETKGNAMCSEYAILSAYIAQKIGEPVHLIMGSATDPTDNEKWREAHAYIWNDSMNCIFDSVLAQGDDEFPVLMRPTSPTTLSKLEEGIDIEARRMGSDFTRIYGLEASGYGVRMDHIASSGVK